MRTPGLSTSAISFSGRILRHHVGALDDDIGRAELDLGGAHRLDRDEGDIPHIVFNRAEHLAGGAIDDEFDRHAKPPPELAREIWRDAFRLAGRRVLLRQYRVAKVDRRSQLAGGREIFQHVGRYGALGQAGNRRSKKHGSSREKCMHGIPFVDGAGRGLSHIIGIDDG